MRSLRLVVLLLAAFSPAASAAQASGPRVAVYLTTKDLSQHLGRQPDLRFSAGPATGTDAIAVDAAARYQALTAGFGVAMTDTSAYVLDRGLPARLRDQALRRLFARRGGIGLSFLRIPLAGSDYVVGPPYSYDDMPAGQVDPGLAHFSIAHDRAYVLPMIRAALRLNHAMTVMANPWTPPAWMKTDDRLVTTAGPLGTLAPQWYRAYASYLVRSLQAYARAGVEVGYLGVQNEPLTPLLLVAGIPESFLDPVSEGSLIHSYVAPALRRAGLRQRIAAYDDGYTRDLAYVPATMAIAGRDVDALAFHCYLSDASSMGFEHSQYPDKVALETECSSKLSNIYPQQMTIRALRNWAQGVQLWNAALDEHLGPKIGNGCKGLVPPFAGQDCIAPVIVDTARHRYRLTSDYWALAQFSEFIRLGARRIASTIPATCSDSPAGGADCGVEDVAFRNPDGTEALVATANDGRAHMLRVSERGRSFAFRLPDGATATFVWRP